MSRRPADAPFLGVGVGLRAPHYREVLSRARSGALRVDWLEAISENYLVPGGRPPRMLDAVRAERPVALHGVSLNVGSADPLDEAYLDELAALVARVAPPWVSDHLCWTGVDGVNLHDLLPLPYGDEAVRHVAARVRRVQERLGRRIALENVSTYLRLAGGMPEWEFLAAVATEADCGILLDVNNVFVSAWNHGFDAVRYLDAIPAERVFEIHLAGPSESGPLLVDTHDHPVREEVWALYAHVLRRLGPVSTLIEWDDRLPPFAELEAEAERARAILAEADGAARSAPRPAGRAEVSGGRGAVRAPALVPVQRGLAGLLRAPEGVRAALAAAGDPAGRSLAPWVVGDERLPAPLRLEIYANAYFQRIHDALAEEYPGLARALGAAGFHDLVTAYLCVHPSRHPSLRWAGAQLPAFLADGAVAEPFRRRWPWAADLARLEWALSEAFDAAEAPPLEPGALASLPPEAWAGLRLPLLPAVRIVHLDWPVHPLRDAAKAPATPQPTVVVVWRRDDTVEWIPVDPLEAELLERADRGEPFAALCARLAAAGAAAQAPARAAAWLATWVARGLFRDAAAGRVVPQASASSTTARATRSRHQAGSPSSRLDTTARR